MRRSTVLLVIADTPDSPWLITTVSGVCSKGASHAAYLIRAHSSHPWHLQRAHLHLAHHWIHVLNIRISTCHGYGDAHVVVHSWLCRCGLVLDSLTEHTVNSKIIQITCTVQGHEVNETGFFSLDRIPNKIFCIFKYV